MQAILQGVAGELRLATEKFGAFHNAHEGYAVLLEEVDELWDAVKLHQKTPERNSKITEEALQVAAMAVRLLYDCTDLCEGAKKWEWSKK